MALCPNLKDIHLILRTCLGIRCHLSLSAKNSQHHQEDHVSGRRPKKDDNNMLSKKCRLESLLFET